MLKPKCIIFDVDGVLLDSLPQHLAICQDQADRFHLPLVIPSVAELRSKIGAGLLISPMLEFFLALGFPASCAKLAVLDYEQQFATHYPPQVFPGVHAMLSQLHQEGISLALVTANIRENIAPFLGESLALFDDRCQFFHRPGETKLGKAEAMLVVAKMLEVPIDRCLYVGDQPSDEAAARRAGCPFFGVTYGWGITGNEGRFTTIASVAEIPSIVMRESVPVL